MTMFILQILLLMLAAYFIGAALACGLRRLFAPQRRVASAEVMPTARPVEPLPRPVPRAAPETVSRFEKALGAEVPRPAPAQAPVAPPPPRITPAAAPAPVAAPIAAAAPVAAKVVHTHAPVEAPHPAPAAELVVPPPPRITITPPASEPAPVAPAATAAAIATAAAAAATAAAVARAAAAPAAPVASVPTPAMTLPTPAVTVTPALAPVVQAPVVQPVVQTAPVAVSTPAPTPTPTPAPTPAADDLTRIRGIDTAIAKSLNGLGVTRYSQIAGWMRPDVTRVNQALGFKHRVERDNWIEQAQILSGRGETLFSRRLTTGQGTVVQPTAQVATAPVAAAAPAAVVAAVTAKPVAAPSVSNAAQAALAAAATTAAPRPVATSAPASQMPANLPPVPLPAATPPRVTDRAAFETAPRSAPVQPSPPVQASAPVAPSIPQQSVAQAAAAVAAATAAVATAPAAAAPAAVNYPPLPPAQPVRPVTMAPTRDALQRISGVNAEIEKLLNVQGVTRYSQIASWGNPEVERFDRLLGSAGRVRRESWIEQAQMLVKGGDTSGARAAVTGASAPVAPPQPLPASTPSPSPALSGVSAVAAATAAAAAAAAASASARPVRSPDAIDARPTPVEAATPPRSDLGNLRSVRSDAFQPTGGGARGASLDDLKRIRGVGVLIEKRLNALGVTSYDQVANWTQDDIARYSHQLDFKGRIERENWVEQARILASGGFTEFSRRVDRGEVETSRPKT